MKLHTLVVSPRNEGGRKLEADFEKAYRTLPQINARIGALKKNLSELRSIKYFKLFGRFKQVKDITKNLSDDFTSFLTIEELAAGTALDIYYNQSGRTAKAFCSNAYASLQSTFANVEETLTIRIKEETDTMIKAHLTSFSNEIPDLIKMIREGIFNKPSVPPSAGSGVSV